MASFTINLLIVTFSVLCWIWVALIVKKILECKRQEINIIKDIKSDIYDLKSEIKHLKNNQ